MNEFEPQIREAESHVVYRDQKPLVDALTKKYELPDSFFDVHHFAARESKGQGIQDPNVWLDALQVKEPNEVLTANVPFDQGRNNIMFTTNGEFPKNLDPNSKEGVLAGLIIGEAKLKAVQREMPETYATGIGLTQRAIEKAQDEKATLIKNWNRAPRVLKLEMVDDLKTFGISITRGQAVAAPMVMSLMMSACSPITAVPTVIAESTRTPITETATLAEIEKVYGGSMKEMAPATLDNYWKTALASGELKDEIAKGLTKESVTGFTLSFSDGSISKNADFVYFIDPITGEERLATQDLNKNWVEVFKVKGTDKNVVIWATGGAGAARVFEYAYADPTDPNKGLIVRFIEAMSVYGDILPNHNENLAVKIAAPKISTGGRIVTRSLERNIKTFKSVENFAEKIGMITVTLDDLKPGSELSKWEQAQMDKIGPIANDPTRIDYYYSPATTALSILDHHKEGDISTGVEGTKFFSFYKIDMGPWGLPGVTEYVVTYAYEDVTGKNTAAHFFATEKQIQDALQKGGLNINTKSKRFGPKVTPGSGFVDIFLVDGNIDIRKIAPKFYESQGYTINQVSTLLQKVASGDKLTSTETAMFKSIIFWGVDGIVKDAELQ